MAAIDRKRSLDFAPGTQMSANRGEEWRGNPGRHLARWPRPADLLMVASLLLCLPACTEESPASDAAEAPPQAHWSYMGIEGPDHWALLTPAYQTCEAGNRQSPINIDMTRPVEGAASLEFRYEPARIFEVNNGHTIQVSHETGCEVGVGSQSYQLRQFHFHSPSEHHIHGQPFPMELHLVHQDEAGRVVVVAVLMETGAERPVLKELWDWLPEQRGKTVSIPLRMNIATILPPKPHYFSYTGSFTTPPCTEGIRWIVLTEPIQISEEDVRQFVDIIGYNARPIQPLEDREIREY